MLGLWTVTGQADEPASATKPKIKALIVDGHSNHPWWETTPILRRILESSERFTVDVATAPKQLREVVNFAPDFTPYQVVMMNYNGDDSVTRTGSANWSESTQKALEDYVRGGGNLSIIHSANNSFPKWKEYNRMIGLGGWGYRSEKDGPYAYYKDNKLVRDDSPGVGGWHGTEHPFQVITREPEHPIMRGLPTVWMHARDELYSHLRGPGENMKILATAYSPRKYTGRNVDEPMVMVLTYGKGRVFHTAMGHGTYSMRCAGFVTLIQRGTEWAATGEVTIPVPKDFPAADTPRESGIFRQPPK
ncbi:MAG: ThuA domain-containing protein [Planctomycetes bacterium]|nr:ThuA domain-containing protein [Planctomycetota bacterium]